MKKIMLLLPIILLSACATRAPYQMAVSDWSGNQRPYYLAGEALNLHVFWDANHDVGKQIDCAVSNSFSAELIWRGILIVPNATPGSYVTANWTPPFPDEGIKFDQGSYIATCNFNDEARASVPVSIVGAPPSA